MNASDTILNSRFFGRCGSIYALCAVLALPALGQKNTAKPPPKADDAKEVKVSDYGTVDISVQDTDLATVLQMLSIESKKNIITGKGVSATVTANLYGVTFYEALKAILDVNGYTFYEEGNFIYVITKEEDAAMQKARRKTESRIFELQNLAAVDANEFILPLLSEAGKASARGEVQPGMKPDVTDAGADSYAFSARLVVNDYPENLDSIATLLSNLDTPPQQVLVEATVIQTALNEANAFGIDFTVLGSLNFSDLTNPLSAVTNLINGKDPKTGFQPSDNNAQALSTNVGNVGGPGGLKIGIVSNDISVFLRVLDEVTDSTVLARPKVMALNRQRAEVLVGARVGYLSTTSTETTTTQSVQFLDTGIQLVFRPFIEKDGMIRMELKPSVSEASLRSVTDATGAIVTIPDELTNQVTTNVRIMDGKTLVLGGLFKDSTSTTHRTVPLLGDIPVLGAAFKGQDDKVERTEVIFLITPSIVHDEKLWAIGADHLAAVDSLRVGARADLLPFSTEKITSNYNQRAVDSFNGGDSSKALHYINNSLSVMPNQPEMIRLREKINGEQAKVHDRSLMERAFRKEMGPYNGTAPVTPSATQPSGRTVSATPTSDDQAAEMSTESFDSNKVAGASDETTFSDMTSSDSSVNTTTSDSDMVMPDPVMPDQAIPDFSTPDQTTTPEPTPGSRAQSLIRNSSSKRASITVQQQIYYSQFLNKFFTAMSMPDLAKAYACSDSDIEAEFPFTTFNDISSVAGVSVSHDR